MQIVTNTVPIVMSTVLVQMRNALVLRGIVRRLMKVAGQTGLVYRTEALQGLSARCWKVPAAVDAAAAAAAAVPLPSLTVGLVAVVILFLNLVVELVAAPVPSCLCSSGLGESVQWPIFDRLFVLDLARHCTLVSTVRTAK